MYTSGRGKIFKTRNAQESIELFKETKEHGLLIFN